jgi:hypothetical protein
MSGNKKTIIIIVLIFVVVLGPVFVLSNIGMGIIQRMVDKNPQGSAAPWFQYTLGKTYYYTLRPEKAAEAFKLYNDRYEENEDRRYWDAMYYRALSLDDAFKSRAAAQLFEYYYYNCPQDDPNRPEVRKECLRLRRHIPTFAP